MARTLKFRAWDGKEMHYDVSIIHGWGAIKKGYFGTVWVEEAKAGIPMQSTGLHDKHGKEIYEGDIDGTDGELMVVCFEDGRFGLKFPCDDGYFEDCIAWDRCEIIGNVYEHSHMCCNPSAKGGENE